MNPNQDTLPTYDLAVLFFGCGTAEELFIFIKNMQWVCQGQNIMDGPGCYAIMHWLLQGDALTAFNWAAMACGNMTLQNYHLVIQDLIMHVLPRCALQIQHRFMHHTLCNTHNVSICDFMTRLVEINQYLNKFLPFCSWPSFAWGQDPRHCWIRCSERMAEDHGSSGFCPGSTYC